MKLIIYLLLTISVLAQDTIRVQSSRQNNLEEIHLAKLHTSKLYGNSASLLEMRINRKWKNNTKFGYDNNLNSPITIEFSKQKTNFIDSDLFIIVVSSAIAFGATAAYFKLESDSAFEKFKTTNDKLFKDKTDKYDLYSGIALGALEFNFGFLIYKFLTD